MRIVGVSLPDNKRVEAALAYIYGIGPTRAKKIMADCQIDPSTRVRDLEVASVAKIQDNISKNYRIEGDLRKELMLNIGRLREIGCYRGIRHKKSLPVRGQRTKTNARTRKGGNKGKKTVKQAASAKPAATAKSAAK
jgi:small subunit ribosomal protein S13